MKLFQRMRWLLLFGLLFAAAAIAAPMTEDQKIDALIHSVEVLPGAQFIRNGSSYDGKAAADHLRSKRRFAGSRIRTADDFIIGIASHSSMSGQPYQVRFGNGKTEDSAVFFRDELRRIEAQGAPSPGPAS
ncbi:MAG TPA: DUF5329 family protein [Xanthomonadaceae bacterium]|jgi:hypothetical protein|nr:DUF5329 family protein [Xanthomonadaceae bacterium]